MRFNFLGTRAFLLLTTSPKIFCCLLSEIYFVFFSLISKTMLDLADIPLLIKEVQSIEMTEQHIVEFLKEIDCGKGIIIMNYKLKDFKNILNINENILIQSI